MTPHTLQCLCRARNRVRGRGVSETERVVWGFAHTTIHSRLRSYRDVHVGWVGGCSGSPSLCLSYDIHVHDKWHIDKWAVPNMRWCFSTLSVRSGSEVKVGGGIEGVRTTQGREGVGGRHAIFRNVLGVYSGSDVRGRGRTEVGSGLKATTGISRWFPGKHVCLTLLIGTGVSTWKRQRGLVGRAIESRAFDPNFGV